MTWRDRAACIDADPDLFFSERTDRGVYKEALAICAKCVVREDCLDWAIKKRSDYGVFGGTTPDERRRIRRRRQDRARKPCGTVAAYVRHIENKEPACDKCKRAKPGPDL